MKAEKVERVFDESAYVLHTWPYRESSIILDVLSAHHGRVRLLGRGAKRSKSGVLRPFSELSVSWSGRSDLKSLGGHELRHHRWLQGDALVCGLYANEITLRALRRYGAEEFLFAAYQELMARLEQAQAGGAPLDAPLRRYELELLASIGYGVNLAVDCDGCAVQIDQWYLHDADAGFRLSACGDQAYSGAVLADIQRRAFQDVEVRRAAKRLVRSALAPHLGPGPLMSAGLHF